MSLSKNPKLRQIAKLLCRDLRKNSTRAEKIFWEAVRNRRFLNKKFYRQYPIFFDMNGKETFFIADFFCFEDKIVVEIDGGIHEKQKDYDLLRTRIINMRGIKVVRFKNEQIMKSLDSVLTNLKGQTSPVLKPTKSADIINGEKFNETKRV